MDLRTPNMNISVRKKESKMNISMITEKKWAKLEKLKMERSYNGVKGDIVQNSQWMDVGQSKVNV